MFVFGVDLVLIIIPPVLLLQWWLTCSMGSVHIDMVYFATEYYDKQPIFFFPFLNKNILYNILKFWNKDIFDSIMDF